MLAQSVKAVLLAMMRELAHWTKRADNAVNGGNRSDTANRPANAPHRRT